MSESLEQNQLQIVDEFLKANLLEALGSDEQRYNYIVLTVDDIAEELSEDATNFPNFSRVAFQPNPSDNEPLLEFVYSKLKEHWKLIDNVYSQGWPVTLLRAVMLEVVRRLTQSNSKHAAITYHANTSAFPFYRYGHEESLIVSNILAEAGRLADAFAIKAFFTDSEADALTPSIDIKLPKNVAVDVSQLQDGLVAAVGPQDENSKAPTTKPANPYWPDSASAWSYQYPKIAAPAIGKAISASVKSGLGALAESTSEALSASLGTITKSFHRTAQFMPRSLEILWWQQALYSPTLECSYRDVDPVVAAISMAHDLNRMDVIPSPESIVHILGEAVRDAVADHDPQHRASKSLGAWLESLSASGDKNLLFSVVDRSPPLPSHSASLLAVVRTTLYGHEAPHETLGVLFEATTTPQQLAMWLFRDILTERLVVSP